MSGFTTRQTPSLLLTLALNHLIAVLDTGRKAVTLYMCIIMSEAFESVYGLLYSRQCSDSFNFSGPAFAYASLLGWWMCSFFHRVDFVLSCSSGFIHNVYLFIWSDP